MKYLADLQKFLEPYKNAEKAAPMKKYLKDRFEFLGIMSSERNALLKEFIKREGIPERSHLEDLAVGCWSLPYREYQYIGMELIRRLMKKSSEEDIYAVEYLLEYKQWWDTVDFISNKLVGKLFLEYDTVREKYFTKWISTNDMWLNRAAILFQLKYKEKTDTKLLSQAILHHSASKEFFHQKAIGWSLREYGKTNPDWVLNFVSGHELKSLSKREALKHLK